MDEINPYQPPTTSEPTSLGNKDGDFRFDGEHLWVRDGARLPLRCIYTNQSYQENPDLKEISKRIAWSNPLFALLLLLNVLVYLIVALCVQKKGQIHFLADKAVLKKKKLHVTLGFLALLASVAALIFGGIYSSNNDDTLLGLVSLLIGLAGMIASIIYMSRSGNTLRASKHQDGWFRLAGCGKPFLDSLSND